MNNDELKAMFMKETGKPVYVYYARTSQHTKMGMEQGHKHEINGYPAEAALNLDYIEWLEKKVVEVS